ncbi:hypothetical protein [Deinococcus ficus]|uniref:Uncharacterized protein n=1 Tax=Deinococcus ficus TaxID=317577 RepID=A0A221T378_9DEIO|nr:hypothetical protein [Deinococcus ficus]ASN83296.1 hypothetical protein DFI_19045 [Deinococcus ficus]
MEKFKTGTTIMGITPASIMLAAGLEMPVLFLLQTFLGGVPFLVVAGLLYWYVFLRLAEWLTEVIPRNYFQHMAEWIIVGNHMYLTNDGDPLPLTIMTHEEIQREQERRAKAKDKARGH